MTIREYLSLEAKRITDRPRPEIADGDAWRASIAERRRQYREMMGIESAIAEAMGSPVNVHVTGVVERPEYRIEKLY
ncbi:MAG TPA: hypothetical protein VKT77_12095, partial [Chthonomonadaceae bacterium]|nr:hypothetical protein [Chthonomonadaceae bacterium]